MAKETAIRAREASARPTTMHGDARAVDMSWRPLLRRMLRISTGVRRTRAPAPGPRGSSQEAPRGPGPDPTEEEAPVLDDEGLRALREELAGELARVAEREREATR